MIFTAEITLVGLHEAFPEFQGVVQNQDVSCMGDGAKNMPMKVTVAEMQSYNFR